jgi:hypothetical protein
VYVIGLSVFTAHRQTRLNAFAVTRDRPAIAADVNNLALQYL